MPWDGAEEVTFECEPGTLAAAQARNAARAGRHAAQPGRRELRRQDPRIQRPGPPRRGDLPGLRLGARPRLRPDQHRPDRRHGRRDVGQLEATASRKTHRPGARTASPSTRWSCRSTRSSRRNCSVVGQDEPAPSPIADWPTKRAWVDYAFDEMAQGRLRGVERLHAGQGQGEDASSSTATACGTGPTCSAPASPRSATSTASTSRTSIRWEAVRRACSTRASCRWAGRCRCTPRELLIREMILQLKTGRLDADYFRRKFGVDILEEFADGFGQLEATGFLTRDAGRRGADARGAAAGRPAAAGVLRAAAPRHAVYVTGERRSRRSERQVQAVRETTMPDDLTFLMGKFPAVLPGELRYARNHMWCRPRGGSAAASASPPTPSG